MDTKLRILEQSVALFNDRGYGAVSLQDIARELDVTRRHIAYHFPTKEDLLKAIAEDMWEKLEADRSQRRDFPSFENLINEAKMYYSFQRSYSFVFQDMHVAKHPVMETRFRELCQQTIRDNEEAIAFAIKLGNMKPEPFPGAYYNLSLAVWVLAFSWMSQQSVRNQQDEEGPGKVIWSLIVTHFTDKGIASFKSFFGDEYYQSLGKPFKTEIDKPIF